MRAEARNEALVVSLVRAVFTGALVIAGAVCLRTLYSLPVTLYLPALLPFAEALCLSALYALFCLSSLLSPPCCYIT